MAEKAYYAEHQQYSSRLAEVGFSPERGNRYAYFAGTGTMESRDQDPVTSRDADSQIGVDRARNPTIAEVSEKDIHVALAGDVHAGVRGKCPDCSFVATCAANIDNDDTLDVWSVATFDRKSAAGEAISAGVPFNDLNDVSE